MPSAVCRPEKTVKLTDENPAFDVMGDLGLGKEFHMMTSEKNRWIPALLETSMADVGPTTPVPWIAPILHRLPKAGQHSRAWLEFVGSQVSERIEKHVDRPDVRFKSQTLLWARAG